MIKKKHHPSIDEVSRVGDVCAVWGGSIDENTD